MSDRVERAKAELEKGFNCAAAVLTAFSEEYGLDVRDARRVAGAFGGGIGRSGGVCGAVSGALMALGLAYAKVEAEDDVARDRCYAEAKNLLEAFETRCGSVNCKDLLGYDVSIQAQYEEARDSGAFRTKCPLFLEAAVELAEERLIARR
jgi:C_GCAxxG_C_C family probable redox protein